MRFFLFLFFLCCLFRCKKEVFPKPKAQLRLEYAKPSYEIKNIDSLPFLFQTNSLLSKFHVKQFKSLVGAYAINLEYTSLKGTIFMTYRPIDRRKDNLKSFLKDAQKLTLEHTIKADEIPFYPYENKMRKVYGGLSEVRGNVASPIQFYITDSVQHFLTGSLYFYAKPNFDSILPAIDYLKKDTKQIMETVVWQ